MVKRKPVSLLFCHTMYVDLFCMGAGQLCWLAIHILAKIYGTHVYKSAKLLGYMFNLCHQ